MTSAGFRENSHPQKRIEIRMMSEAPSKSPVSVSVPTTETPPYWCYHCEKRVSTETLPNPHDVICGDCKNGFVEHIPPIPTPTPTPSSDSDDPYFGSHFLHVLRLIAQSASDDDDDASPPPPPNRSPHHDFLRIELGGWDNNDEDDDDEDREEQQHHHDGGTPSSSVSHEPRRNP